MTPQLLVLVFDRANVLDMNIQPPLSALRQLSETAQTARMHKHCVRLAFEGYEQDTNEVYEDRHVREFIRSLTEEFPYWLHFASLEDDTLFTIMNCLAPPESVTTSPTAGQVRLVIDAHVWNEQLMTLFGHMNALYAQLGLSQTENSATTQAVAGWCRRVVG